MVWLNPYASPGAATRRSPESSFPSGPRHAPEPAGGPGGGAPHLRHLGPTLESSMMDRVFLHAVGMQNRIFHLGRLGHGGQRLGRGLGGKVLPHLPPLLLLRRSLPLSRHLGLWKRGILRVLRGEARFNLLARWEGALRAPWRNPAIPGALCALGSRGRILILQSESSISGIGVRDRSLCRSGCSCEAGQFC